MNISYLAELRARLPLFSLSVFILFLELLLIRWVGTEVSIFSYLQNAILICCFLGLGLGCISKPSRFPLRVTFELLAVFTVLLSIPFLREQLLSLALLLSTLHDFVVWNQIGAQSSTLGQVSDVFIGAFGTFLLAGFLWKMMVPLGTKLSELINSDPSPITAYSVNVAGSLIGIWLFTALCNFSLSPYVWLFVLGIISLPIVRADSRFGIRGYTALLAVVLVPIIGQVFETDLETKWSPYQKIQLSSIPQSSEHLVLVNNTGYQQIQNNSRSFLETHAPELLQRHAPPSQYDLPGRLAPHAQEVLIVGAGTGNDVAGALRTTQGAITAVEIDPTIVDLGVRYHPERPYQSPRVSVITDDARAVFMRDTKKYDLIVFGLLDSHSTPTLTNARLDHYVYTLESLTQAARLLTPDGILVLIFEPQRHYVVSRLSTTLKRVFGELPLVVRAPINEMGWGGVCFITGNQETLQKRIASDPELARFLTQSKVPQSIVEDSSVHPTTDNWPYLYLRSPTVPMLFFVLGLILVGLWIQSSTQALERFSWKKRLDRDSVVLLAMGAGFSLFEVYGVNQAAVLFGSSWMVNSIVISSILTMILFANFCTRGTRSFPHVSMLGVLVGGLLLLSALNISPLTALPSWQKGLIAFLLFGGPMFLSGIVFAGIFKTTKERGTALGANLLGALVGGVLQLLTFPFGLKSLLIAAAVAYGVAAVLEWCRDKNVTRPAP